MLSFFKQIFSPSMSALCLLIIWSINVFCLSYLSNRMSLRINSCLKVTKSVTFFCGMKSKQNWISKPVVEGHCSGPLPFLSQARVSCTTIVLYSLLQMNSFSWEAPENNYLVTICIWDWLFNPYIQYTPLVPF